MMICGDYETKTAVKFNRANREKDTLYLFRGGNVFIEITGLAVMMLRVLCSYCFVSVGSFCDEFDCGVRLFISLYQGL